MARSLCVFLILGWALSAMAQAPARKPRTLSGGVCGTTNWVCVSECIDSECVEQCMREGCEQALARLRACTEKAGCAPDDSTCSAKMCGGTCQQAFEPAPRSPEKENPQPCAGFQAQGGGKGLEKVIGRWELSAATLTGEPKEEPAELDPKPRPDYVRTLEVTPSGCFLLSTELKEATLGRGNSLAVRAWGTFAVSGDEKVVLLPKDGQAVGQVCGKPRTFGLSKGRFMGPRYTFTVEKDTLTLVADDETKRTFQFQRVQGDGAPEPAKKK
ncbi:hypothetical protein [Hyalangium versicolor]|uniref:hypothetical protein n=1 Tax=Hyalangium versicolor TaxID=2861190 RepID=UPI001CC9EF2C|nr:hypothetical protein [Hyalangium versicolor]